MSSPFIVPDGWTITFWEPDAGDSQEGIPRDGVKKDGPLSISQPDPSENSFSMQWLNQRDEPCSVSGLQSDQEQTMLQGQNLTVSFGGKPVQCDLTVALTADPDKLRCRLNLPEWRLRKNEAGGPDTGGGTFTATANPG
jgi:hypothetical protein